MFNNNNDLMIIPYIYYSSFKTNLKYKYN